MYVIHRIAFVTKTKKKGVIKYQHFWADTFTTVVCTFTNERDCKTRRPNKTKKD